MHHKSGTVGRLLPGIEYRLEKMEGIAEGGRLMVRGPNVMKGYLRAEHPGALLQPEDGWYDTGDIVTLDEEGYMIIRGRAKRFAKVGGEMVSLAAVEVLAARLWPEYHHAAVALPDQKKGEQIVLVTSFSGATREKLLEYARAEGVGELGIPRVIRTVKSLPLLGTGKVDYPQVQVLAWE